MNLEKIDRTNLPPSGLLNLEGERSGGPGGSIQNFRKVGPAHAKLGREVSDCLLEGVSVSCHATSVVCDTIKSRGYEIVPASGSYDAVVMTTWPQRTSIQAAVLAYRRKHGLNPERMADLLGVGHSYLHNLLYDKRVWPSLDIAQKLSEILGLRLGEVVDDPGASVEGAPEGASEVDRFMLKAMGSDLTKLTDTQKQAAMEAWRAIIRGYVKQ